LRKRALVEAISAGEISASEACARYAMSAAELAQWTKHYRVHGVAGLYSTLRQPREMDCP
jgi:hypothetical protein